MTTAAISRSTGGYTVLELLVVVTIIIALMALLIGVFPRTPEEKRRTELIISAVQNGITLAQAQSGSAFSPVEHPLAGSQAGAGAERFAFVRSDPRWSGTVATSGMAANLAEEVGVTLPMVERAQARIFGISVARFRESGARMKAIAAAREAQP